MDSSPSVPILISSFHPFPTISFVLPSYTQISDLPEILEPILPIKSQSISTFSANRSIDSNSVGSISDLLSLSDGSIKHNNSMNDFLHLRLVPKVLGGKGGFGSQLRAAGGRMSSQKTQNNDSCRDLSGRRLSTIKEAQKLAAAIAAEPERQAEKKKELEERLKLLNQEVERLDALVNGTDDSNLKKSRRINDSHQLNQSKEGIQKLRSAVAEALLKKKQKKIFIAKKNLQKKPDPVLTSEEINEEDENKVEEIKEDAKNIEEQKHDEQAS
ncbi:telomere stability and silencing-domain-containing protein [Phakopsora pachyrhizi]|nr:telomere stability and silencing-domain-containing protein [Phakopsora pachyrhizi]